jgi:hypothetical protein
MLAPIERGDVDGCSFGFITQNDTWEELGDGTVVRTLLDIDLDEISITPFPAYPATSVNLRSAPREMRAKLQTRDIGDECGCECGPCMDGDCDECTEVDCDDENCSCADKRAAKAAESATVSESMRMRLRLAEARMK